MTSRSTYRMLVCAVVALGICAPASLAVFIGPGMATAAAGELDPLGGPILAASGPVPFAATNFSGTLTSTVIADATNPLGGLTFTYELVNSGASINSIGRLTVLDFTAWLTDVSFQTPAAGLVPSLTDRSTVGDFVGFSFVSAPLGSGVLPPGMTSALLVIQTNAPSFKPGVANAIDGSVAGDVFTYAPVPEPVTLALLAVGGLAVLRRRI